MIILLSVSLTKHKKTAKNKNKPGCHGSNNNDII